MLVGDGDEASLSDGGYGCVHAPFHVAFHAPFHALVHAVHGYVDGRGLLRCRCRRYPWSFNEVVNEKEELSRWIKEECERMMDG